jgi:hypothetical protein
MRRPAPSRLVALTLAAAIVLAAGTASASEPVSEEFRYRWHLGSLLGRIAGLFLPSHGDGVLSIAPASDGRMTSELLITSEESRDGEYWRYGSEMDPETGLAVRAWSSYRWRGEEKSKEAEIDAEEGVRDVVSGIWSIRQDPPERPRPMEIWSDGKVYSVMVVPRGRETRSVDGRKVATRHYTVSGYDVPGRRRWKGTLELWLAEDAAATPVEIHISRNLADLRLELQSLP